MLVHCPECNSPVFVRSAAIEQRKPQRCYSCRAQLLVDPDGAVEIAVSGPRTASPPIVRPKAAEPPPRRAAAPRPITVVTTTAALARSAASPRGALDTPAVTREEPAPAPVSLPGLPHVSEPPSELAREAPSPPPEVPLAIPRQASLPDLPTMLPDEELPFGGVTEALGVTAIDHDREAALLAAAAQRKTTDPRGMLSPFDTSAEGAPPPSRFADVPVEELFDRSGGHLTQPTFDDPPPTAEEELLMATGVPLSLEPLEEEPPVVEGSLLPDEPLELPSERSRAGGDGGQERAIRAPLAPVREATTARASKGEAAPAVGKPIAQPSTKPIAEAAAQAGVEPIVEPLVDAEVAEPSSGEEPARSTGGALGWAAALALGVGLGTGALFLFPPEIERTPLEQKLFSAAELLEKGRPEEAIPLLEDALRAAPDHPLALRRLAIAASLVGDGAAAERHYLRYLERSDDEDDKRQVRMLLEDGAS